MIRNLFTQEPMHSIINRQVKAPLVAMLNLIDAVLPMPVKALKGNNGVPVRRRKRKILIDMWDWFSGYWVAASRIAALRAIAKLFIIVYDYDSPYTYAIDKLAGEFLEHLDFLGRTARLLESKEDLKALEELCSSKYAEFRKGCKQWQPVQEGDADSRAWRE